MANYAYPIAGTYIAPDGTFADHVARHSSQPGVDYSGSGTTYGSPVKAVLAGTVTSVKTTNSGTYGREVHVDHGSGISTRYMHLNSVAVAAGDSVAQGTLLGGMGGSASGGDATYSAHIHICLIINGTYVDFNNYVGTPGPGTPTATPTTNEEENFMNAGFLVTNASGNVGWYSRVNGKIRALTQQEWTLLTAEAGGDASTIERVAVSNATYIALL